MTLFSGASIKMFKVADVIYIVLPDLSPPRKLCMIFVTGLMVFVI